MTPEAEAKIMADTAEAWKQTNIAVILSEMRRYGLTLADLQEADRMDAMVTLLEPHNPALAQRNTVASE